MTDERPGGEPAYGGDTGTDPLPKLATPLRRLAARIVDALVLLLLNAFLWVVGVLGSLATQGIAWEGRDDLAFGLPFGPKVALVAAIIGAVYEIAFVAYRGQTPGKILLGIMVVDAEGGGFPSPSAASVRWLVPHALAFLPLLGWLLRGIAYAWLLVDPRRQGWHDRAARTLVVTAP